jgi:hypothetical protein
MCVVLASHVFLKRRKQKLAELKLYKRIPLGIGRMLRKKEYPT